MKGISILLVVGLSALMMCGIVFAQGTAQISGAVQD